MKIASIVLCAGLSGRINSKKSKMLHTLGGKPTAYWSIKNALEVTSTKPIIVLGHQADEVKKALDEYFVGQLIFAVQTQIDGTGSAVKTGVPHLDPDVTSVLVMYGDTPLIKPESLQRLVNIQKQSHVPIAMFSSFAPDPTGYGRIVRNANEHIAAIVEEKDANMAEKEIREINPGVYIFDAEFLRGNINRLSNDNPKKEYLLTDLIRMYVKNGPKHGPVESVEVSYDEVHGVNDRRQLAYAHQIINRRMLDAWMLKGVTFLDPNTTSIEETVTFDEDVTIYPNVHLRGKTHIKTDAVVETGSVLTDTIVGEGAHILPYSVICGATIEKNASIGPFARLRQDTVIKQNAKIGNFVEVKASSIGEGSKVNHLAYIGDAEIQEHTNIGAGVITANFDGVTKHKTVIGASSFVGSNVTLIAPIVLGQKSYVAAGSTLNRDLAKESLGIARARQEVKPLSEKTRKTLDDLSKK